MKKILWVLLMFLIINVNVNAVQSRKDARAVHKPNDSIDVLNVSTLTATNIYTEQITVSSIVVILSTTNALKTDSIESNTSGNVRFLSPAFIPNVQVGTESVRTDLNNYTNVNSTTNAQVETNKQTINGYIVANSTNSGEFEILRGSVNTLNNYQLATASNTGQIIGNTEWISKNSTAIANAENYRIVTASSINNSEQWIVLNSSNIPRWDLIGTAVSTTAWYCDGTNQWNSNSGNIGIGITNPTAKLDVNGLIVSTAINVNGKLQESGFDLVPAGVMWMYGSTVAPSGWLLCDGSVVSRTTYANLWNAIGGSYGWGDESTTFNLPNMKGKVATGYDVSDSSFSRIGLSAGTKNETLTVAQMPAHSHNLDSGYTGTSTVRVFQGTTLNDLESYTTATGGDGQHNNLQPYVVVNYIIKY